MSRKLLAILFFLGLCVIFYISRNRQLFLYKRPAISPTPLLRQLCTQHKLNDPFHQHVHLTIKINDRPVYIPANIGIYPERGCMTTIHTHDNSGIIHLEMPYAHALSLADFFKNWGKPFSRTRLLDKQIDSTHAIVMTVNGKLNDQYEHLVLENSQFIEIRYQKI